MSHVYITGESGRLGTVLVETFRARGDVIIPHINLPIINQIFDHGYRGPMSVNYIVFAHRYRGTENYGAEMQANLTYVANAIYRLTWAEGDRAIVIVSSI